MRRPLALAISVIVAVTLTSCGGGSSKETINGTITVTKPSFNVISEATPDDFGSWLAKESTPCLYDVPQDLEITNAAGEIVAVARLDDPVTVPVGENEEVPPTVPCVVEFSAEVPASDFYKVKFGSVTETLTAEDLKADDWNVTLTATI